MWEPRTAAPLKYLRCLQRLSGWQSAIKILLFNSIITHEPAWMERFAVWSPGTWNMLKIQAQDGEHTKQSVPRWCISETWSDMKNHKSSPTLFISRISAGAETAGSCSCTVHVLTQTLQRWNNTACMQAVYSNLQKKHVSSVSIIQNKWSASQLAALVILVHSYIPNW